MNYILNLSLTQVNARTLLINLDNNKDKVNLILLFISNLRLRNIK